MTTVTINSNIYSDDGTAVKDMLNGGHREHFFDLVQDVVIVAGEVSTDATSAAASEAAAIAAAATAVAAPGTSATSTTSVAIGTGSKAFTIQTGKSLVVGMSVKIAETATPTNWMFGDITAYDSGTGALTVNVIKVNGSGTIAAWTVSLSGVQGVAGGAGGANSVAETSGSANITLTSSSDVCQSVAMTVMGKHVTLPDATTLEEGGPRFLIRNAGGYPIGVRDSAGTLVAAVAAGGFVNLYLIDNSTAAGVWSYEGTNLEPGLIGIDNTFSSTYASTVLKPFVALDDDKSIHFLALASGFAAVAVDKTTGAVGTPVTVSATASMVPKQCFKVTSTTAVVFCGTDDNVLYAIVVSLSGATTLAVGAIQGKAATGISVEDFSGAPKVAQLDSTHYLVSYATATGAGTTSVAAMEITSGTTCTWGAAVNIITSNNVANSTTTYALTATTGLVLYGEGSSPNIAAKAVIISVAGTVCTVNSPVASGIAHPDTVSVVPSSCQLSSTKFLLAHRNTGTTTLAVVAGTISGTVITFGALCGLSENMDTVGYTVNSATRYNPHLSPLSASTALLWYFDSSVSRAVVLSESGGTVTAGAKLYRSISAAASTAKGGGGLLSQGTDSFVSYRLRVASTDGYDPILSVCKIAGTAITPGASFSPPGLPAGQAYQMLCGRLSSGDYVFQGFSDTVGTGELIVFRTNGDAINYRGNIKMPSIIGTEANGPMALVSSNRAVITGVDRQTTVGASTYQLRLLSVEICQS